MFKSVRLFAALLVVAGALSAPGKAEAFPMLCGVASSYVANTNNVTSPLYGWFVGYLVDHCGGGY